MTEPLIATIRELGVSNELIKVESFASPSRAITENTSNHREDRNSVVPAATDLEGATLRFARSGNTVTHLAGKTILEIAEDHGVEIPYDCRSGICGQCKTKLLAGTVKMEAEDALEPVDRANGLILSCQARCLDDVVIDA
jgi:glycine betaine catabolism B